MPVSPDLLFQNFSSAQSDKQPQPATIASAATIAPTTRFSRITGSTPITTITPPLAGYHELILVFSAATVNAINTGGNIAVAWTAVIDRPISLHYDPRTGLYYPETVA